MNLPNSGLYHEIISGSGEECNSGGLQQVVQNDILCGNN